MHNEIRRSAVVACALLISLACARLSNAAPPDAPKPAASVITDRASAMFDAGQFAKAKAALDGFLAAPPAGTPPDEIKKAQKLLDQSNAALLEQYRSVEAARERAKANEAKRTEETAARKAAEAKTRAEADRLAKKAEAGDSPETNSREAIRLYTQIAADNAQAALSMAMDYYSEGQYTKARPVLELLNKYITDHAKEPQFLAGLGTDPGKRVADYLKKLPDAQENLDQGKMLAMASVTPPVDVQRAKALKMFDEANVAFDKGQFDEAQKQFEDIKKMNVSLGNDKDALLAARLKQIADRKKDLETRRLAAAANLKAGDDLLKKDNWQGAKEFLLKADKDHELLAPEQRTQLVGLLTDVEAREKKATAEAETAKRVEDYLRNVKNINDILEQQKKATAAMYLKLAKDDYDMMNYDGALENVKEALNHQPDNAEALKLKEQILFATGEKISPMEYKIHVSDEQRALYDEVRTKIDLAIQRGRSLVEQKKFVEAVDQFNRALDSLEFLRPAMDVREVEGRLRELVRQAETAKAQSDEELRRAKEIAALKERQAAVSLEHERLDKQKIYLFTQANAEFAKGNYDNAVKVANEVLVLDPENGAARDLIKDARMHLRRKTWDSILDADQKAVEDERVRLRMKAIFPGAIFLYPAKELWEEIKARPPVDLPSGKAVRTPKELELESILDQELKGISPLKGISLTDAMETVIKPTVKTLTGKELSYQIDPSGTIGDTTITVPELRDTSIRNLLLNMLRPSKLNFIISRDRLYISDFSGCRKEEAMGDLSLRQYDLSDLMIILELTSANSGSNGSSSSGISTGVSTGINTGVNSGVNSGTTGTGTGSGGMQEVINLILEFTGPINWDSGNSAANMVNSGTTTGITGTTGTTGVTGTTGTTGISAVAVGEPGVSEDVMKNNPPGRIYYGRGVWLMVNQTDRIHKQIEELLAELRAQTHIQVQVEASFLEWTDNFMKDVGVQWQQLPIWNVGGQNLPFGGHIPGSVARLTYNQEPSVNPESLTIFQLGVTFLNQAQTTLLIHAAESSQNAIVTDTPHVTCINTVASFINLSTSGVYVGSYNVLSGIAVPVMSPYTPSSVGLNVQPYVTADRRYVNMILSPNFTTSVLGEPVSVTIPIQGITTAGGQNVNTTVTLFTPLTTTNFIQSTIKVPDRGSAIMGGLSHVEEVRQEGGVPILSHIPIIKRLFLNTAIAKQRFHNVFLASPTIMLEKEYEP